MQALRLQHTFWLNKLAAMAHELAIVPMPTNPNSLRVPRGSVSDRHAFVAGVSPAPVSMPSPLTKQGVAKCYW